MISKTSHMFCGQDGIMVWETTKLRGYSETARRPCLPWYVTGRPAKPGGRFSSTQELAEDGSYLNRPGQSINLATLGIVICFSLHYYLCI